MYRTTLAFSLMLASSALYAQEATNDSIEPLPAPPASAGELVPDTAGPVDSPDQGMIPTEVEAEAEVQGGTQPDAGSLQEQGTADQSRTAAKTFANPTDVVAASSAAVVSTVPGTADAAAQDVDASTVATHDAAGGVDAQDMAGDDVTPGVASDIAAQEGVASGGVATQGATGGVARQGVTGAVAAPGMVSDIAVQEGVTSGAVAAPGVVNGDATQNVTSGVAAQGAASGVATAPGVTSGVAAAPGIASGVAAPGVIDPKTYKPRTPYDNSPWRFDMDKSKEGMSAEAFAAWMEARGVRIARGAAHARQNPTMDGMPAIGSTLPGASDGRNRKPRAPLPAPPPAPLASAPPATTAPAPEPAAVVATTALPAAGTATMATGVPPGSLPPATKDPAANPVVGQVDMKPYPPVVAPENAAAEEQAADVGNTTEDDAAESVTEPAPPAD